MIAERLVGNMVEMYKLKVAMLVVFGSLVFYSVIPSQTSRIFLLPSGEELHSQDVENDPSTLAKAGSSGSSIPQEPTGDVLSQGAAAATDSSPMPRNILVTSVGRSGSSFFGELIASHGNNMYFFEPLRAVKQLYYDERYVQAELTRTFRCDIREELINRNENILVNIKHNSTRGLKRGDAEPSKIIENCKKEPVRIIKTIRSRLSWTKQLLEDEDLDLKVIHLVRDPRGTFLSMSKVGWKSTPKNVCGNILQDLKEREVMERLYPERYFFIKYEDLCRDPYGRTRAIFRFLRGELSGYEKYVDLLYHRNHPLLHNATKKGPMPSHASEANNRVALALAKALKERSDPGSYSDLPKGVLAFLKSHTRKNIFLKEIPWTTVRDTPSMYWKWRKTISQAELTELETQCRRVIQALNYKLFGTVEAARNLSISLFDDPEISLL